MNAASGRLEPLMEVYHRLFRAYGPQGWWPGDSPFEIVVGAILTQATAWTNVEKAMDNLKQAEILSPCGLRDVPTDELALLIRSSGYFNVKARRLKAFIRHLWDAHNGSLESLLNSEGPALRRELLSIHGLGEETADDILLYAAVKPFFVIDAYTRRIIDRVGLYAGAGSYTEYQRFFHEALPVDTRLFNEYHALLVRHGKDVCRPTPLCEKCCLREICSFA